MWYANDRYLPCTNRALVFSKTFPERLEWKILLVILTLFCNILRQRQVMERWKRRRTIGRGRRSRTQQSIEDSFSPFWTFSGYLLSRLVVALVGFGATGRSPSSGRSRETRSLHKVNHFFTMNFSEGWSVTGIDEKMNIIYTRFIGRHVQNLCNNRKNKNQQQAKARNNLVPKVQFTNNYDAFFFY